jgi:trigger factor
MNNRPSIPNEIKQKVRQKCKFACTVCRCPVYEYDHLTEYSKCKEHTVENIFLLCPTCHTKKHNGTISKDTIIHAQQKLVSHNIIKDQISGNFYKLILGNNIIEKFNGYLYKILEINYFKLTTSENSEYPCINAKFYNESNNLCLEINNNEYVLHTDFFDILSEGGWIKVKAKKYDKYLELKFDSENNVIKILGRLYLNEKRYIDINEKGIFYKNNLLASNCVVKNAKNTGFLITNKPESFGVGFYNCRGMHNCTTNNCDVGFVWTNDFFETIEQN